MDLFLRRYSEWEEVIYTAIYMVISVLAVIGNGVVSEDLLMVRYGGSVNAVENEEIETF